jgi:hypothetical protein
MHKWAVETDTAEARKSFLALAKDWTFAALAAEKQERPAVEADPATPSNLRPSHNIAFLRAYQIPGLSENPVRQRMVATVAYHVRMNGEGHGALPKARNQRMKSLRRNRPGAL